VNDPDFVNNLNFHPKKFLSILIIFACGINFSFPFLACVYRRSVGKEGYSVILLAIIRVYGKSYLLI